jgi:hypothetical protein
MTPSTSFDPTIVGPGLVSGPSAAGAWWVIIVVFASSVAFLAWRTRGWRRALLVVLAAVPLGWAGIGTFAPISLVSTGFGPGPGTEQADVPAGIQTTLLYVVAGPTAPYAFGVSLFSAGPVPFTLDGIEVDTSDHVYHGSHVAVAMALWLDEQPIGGMTGPGAPFAPIPASGNMGSIWIVQRSSDCADGPFGPADSVHASVGWTTQTSLPLRVTVFGWPRTVEVPLPDMQVATPEGLCPGTPASP